MLRNYSNLILLGVLLLLTQCRPDPIPADNFVSKAYNDTLIAARFSNITNFKSGTRAVSAKLNDGRSLWLFSDANIYDGTVGQFMSCAPTAKNCALVEQNGTLTLLNSSSADYLPPFAGIALKPLSAYQFLDTVFCLCKDANSTSSKVLYVSKLAYPSLQFLRTDTFTSNNTVLYGYTIATNKTLGFVYCYGIKQPSGNSNELYVARYSLLTPHSQWYYFSSGLWDTFDTAATPITNVGGESFSIIQHKDDYALIAQEAAVQCGQARDIVAFYGINEYGIWQNRRVMYSNKERNSNIDPQIGDVQFHSSDINGNAEILCTYSIKGYEPCLATCTNGVMPQNARGTRFFRLPLSHIYNAWKP
jgi:hypothetical protein